VAGLIPATSGSLYVAGCDVQYDLLEIKQRLAYVPDDPPLFDDLSVIQHLEFIGRLYRVADYREKAEQLLRQFDLIEKYRAGATTLSRGMRQKLAISCAYMHDPDVLLLDEPLTGLDPPGIRALLASIRRRAADGATVIISSHLLAMIEDICTDLLVMQSGRIRYFGAANELRRQYPKAKTLEQAYFAATGDAELGAANASSPMPICTISITDYRNGALA
jgi:ABC-2 type transport system ATP-binding protein